MSGLTLAVFDGGGKFLYQTSLGVKPAADGDGLEADLTRTRLNGKLTEIEWRDASGKFHTHRHDQGALGFAVLDGDIRIGRSGTAPK